MVFNVFHVLAVAAKKNNSACELIYIVYNTPGPIHCNHVWVSSRYSCGSQKDVA